MYSLLQIILALTSNDIPTVNVITHFDNLKICERKLDETLKRNIDGGNKAEIILDSEKNKILKIKFNHDATINYWFCKQTIFFK